MYGRTALPALRGLMRLNGPIANSGAACVRHFSATPSYGVRKVYTPTDNAELNPILKEIQEKIIYPAYLPHKQRKIVFDPTKRSYLEQNPIDIEVEGQEYRFKSIDPSQDIQKSTLMLWNALKAMKTKADWQNLGTLLAGFQKAGISLTPSSFGKIFRLTSQADRIELLVDCLQQSHDTGLYLQNKEQFVHVFMAICRRVDAAGGDVEKIRQAAKMGDAFLDIVQRPEHMKNVHSGRDTRDFLHFSAVGRAMLLYARASLAQAKQGAGQPIDEDLVTIKDDLALLQSLWAPHLKDGAPLNQLPELRELNPAAAQTTKGYNRSMGDKIPSTALSVYAYLESLAWTIRGLQAAEDLAPDEATPLLPLVESIKKHAGDVSEAGGENKAEWLERYKLTLGSN